MYQNVCNTPICKAKYKVNSSEKSIDFIPPPYLFCPAQRSYLTYRLIHWTPVKSF